MGKSYFNIEIKLKGMNVGIIEYKINVIVDFYIYLNRICEI